MHGQGLNEMSKMCLFFRPYIISFLNGAPTKDALGERADATASGRGTWACDREPCEEDPPKWMNVLLAINIIGDRDWGRGWGLRGGGVWSVRGYASSHYSDD